MHSSTSNSDVQWVRANWRKIWAATFVVALLMLAAWEVFWRVKGFRPSMTDDARLWASARRSVRPDSVVLVGSSRMHADVQPAIFASATGRHTVQLAVNGGLSYLVLEHLANDENFTGTVICELWEVEIVTGLTTHLEREMVTAYKQASLAERSEGVLQRFVQNRFAFALPQLAFSSVVQHWWKRSPITPSPHYRVMEDRTLLIDFSLLNLEMLQARTAAGIGHRGPALTPEDFVARTRRFEMLAEKITQRGGRVIFMRFPVSGVIWDELEKSYPKAAYWDQFAQRSRFPTIHFRDYTDLHFECPDYSHLDTRQAALFTESLAKILLKKKLIDGGKD